MNERERPPKISPAALTWSTGHREIAEYHLLDDPLWLPFFLYNQDVLTKLLRRDKGLRRQFIRRTRAATRRASWDESKLAFVAADIQAHPFFDDKEKRNLLAILHRAPSSITATPGGLPTLGKRR